MQVFIAVIYTVALLPILLYSLTQFHLVFTYFKAKEEEKISEKWVFTNPSEIPRVTIQLYVHNKYLVVEKLLQNKKIYSAFLLKDFNLAHFKLMFSGRYNLVFIKSLKP